MRTNVEPRQIEERPADEGLRFARRVYLPRVLGLALGAVCIGGALRQQGAGALAWIALAVNAFLWPHLAYLLARRAGNPYRAELRNLVIDSACGGAWMAVIGLNLVPSAVLVAMLAMDKVSVGGGRFLARCLAAQAAAGAAAAAAFGFELRLASSLAETLASVPLLVVFPIAFGLTTYRLARRVRAQTRMLAALSSTDGLTGLLNRGRSEAAVAGEFERCRRAGDAALMMIDVDHFKSINDRHGHLVGDQVIRAVAQMLRDCLRVQDVAGRYGGEEFIVVLPGADVQGTEALAERVRKRIESATLDGKAGVRATVSIGVAVFDPRDEDYLEWIARADRALYAAKDGGRNRTARCAREPGAPEGTPAVRVKA